MRGALALVERAEAPYGIVYSTDAKVSSYSENSRRIPERQL